MKMIRECTKKNNHPTLGTIEDISAQGSGSAPTADPQSSVELARARQTVCTVAALPPRAQFNLDK